MNTGFMPGKGLLKGNPFLCLATSKKGDPPNYTPSSLLFQPAVKPVVISCITIFYHHTLLTYFAPPVNPE